MTADPAPPDLHQSLTDWCRQVCLGLPDATTDEPFGPGAHAFRIRGRMFALLTKFEKVSEHPVVNLKALPSEIPLLIRDQELVLPGFHMNKKHWVTVVLAPDLDLVLARDLIEESYDHVLARLPGLARASTSRVADAR